MLVEFEACTQIDLSDEWEDPRICGITAFDELIEETVNIANYTLPGPRR